MADETLAERIEAKRMAKTDWDTDKKNWEYISIPAENAIGERHDSVAVNEHVFDAGQTYLVPPAVAASVKERLAVYAKACIRILQPKRDVTSEQQVQLFGRNKTVQPVDPSTLKQ
jgi:hypothetical protein